MKKQFLQSQVALIALANIFLFSCTKEKQIETSTLLEKEINKSSLRASLSPQNLSETQLLWSDEFNNTGTFDTTKWSYADRGTVAWNKYMTHTLDYVSQDGNNLLLRMDNAIITGDAIPYHSGGVKSIGKFSMTYGKVEVRAKFTKGRGSWPAIWMMPEPATQHSGWPGGGEIDIMEHVNNENVIYHTIHNATVTSSNGGSTASKAASYNTTDYNVYTMEWTPIAIRFYVNNVLQYTYAKATNATWQQWPFDVPFYLILNQAGGAGWPGAITDADLPFSMQVDYVRVYSIPVFANGGFETGTLSPWTTWGGGASIVSNDTNTGTKCIKLTGGENAIEQVVTGLKPNTTYRFSGVGKVSTTGQSVSLGVKNYGGSQTSISFTNTTYQNQSVTFTTGSTNTSAVLFFYKYPTGTVYGDDFLLEEL